MTNPLNVTFTDLVGPPISAAWLNAVTQALGGSASPTVIVATAGQTVFTVPSGVAGVVYINGVYQIPGTSFVRTNDTTITFSEGVPYNAKVIVL